IGPGGSPNSIVPSMSKLTRMRSVTARSVLDGRPGSGGRSLGAAGGDGVVDLVGALDQPVVLVDHGVVPVDQLLTLRDERVGLVRGRVLRADQIVRLADATLAPEGLDLVGEVLAPLRGSFGARL